MKNPFGQIVSFEDYVDIIGIPKEQLNSEEVKNRINKWLVQATEQFDSMISGNGQLGRLYRWFEKLEDNEEDNYKKYKLIKAICSWVETFVIKGKFWVDGLPVINSNVDIQINSSSNDSNVEAKRKDIIQDLVSVGLYQTTNFGDNNTFQDNQQNAEQLIEDLIVLSTSELQQNYLRLNPQKSLEGNLDFANNDLVNGGNIIGSTQHARNNIQYYNIIDSTIDLNKNTIIGSLPQDPTTAADIAQINQNIASINQEQITQNTNISNNANEINGLKAKDIEQNNRITTLTQQVNTNKNNITNLATVQNQHDQLIQANKTNIQTNTNSITALDGRLVSVSGLLDQTIDGLRTLKPFEYVGEYQNGTSYNINQLVSYQNNLYLSKEDNNNTTPPSDKWLLLNEDFASIDLNDYYTKLEVDSIKNNLQQSITSNTNNITTNQTSITNLQNNYNTLNSEVVKLAGNQTITGEKTFTNNLTISNNPTPLILKANTNDKTYMLIKSSDNTTNFSLGANSTNTSLEVNRGDLTLTTLQSNKNVNFENVAKVKFNRSVLEMGTEINAGFGGGSVKFIPEDNSTKTLQFYNNQPNDTRRFKLLVPEPTEAQNPATKNYVDNLNNQNVKLTGDQSIGGNKTFTQPITVATPTADTHAATKAYVDNAIQNITPGSGGSIDTSNFATLNTAQTITGAKTFDNQVVIRKDGTPLTLRAVNPGKIYMIMKGADDNANFSLGANSSNTSLEVNRGDLTISTQQANKNIAFENAARIKFNRSVLEMGTEINAGFGGGEVKFIPEDNTTKTLQFYNNSNTDQRRFNLLIPEPTQANNPTTKAYVDTAIAGVNTSGNVPQQTLDQINNNTTNITNLQNEVSGQATSIGTNTNNINNLTNRTNTIEQNYVSKNTNTEQVIEGPITFRRQVSAQSTPSRASDLTNKQYVDNNSLSKTATAFQTVASSVSFLRPITVQTPTANTDAANKQYVDRTVDNMINIFTDNTRKYSNLQTINVSNLFSRTNINYTKPLIVSFTRYNGNNNTQLGTHTGIIYAGTGNKHMLISDTYVVQNGNITDGRRAGLLITPSQIKVQCWDGNDRIGNIVIYGWAKALS